jgi:C-22 sterol desaturase
MQMSFRNLNLETSLRVFCGDYITEQGTRDISDSYWCITKALELVNFPLAVPGTKVYRAIQARKVAVRWFEFASAESKKRIAAGGTPNCLVDRWVREMLASKAAPGHSVVDADDDVKSVPIREFTDNEIALVLFVRALCPAYDQPFTRVQSFLFASQDAMTSGITYAMQHLADHPHVFAKVRAEQDIVRGGDTESSISLDQLDRMPYLRAVVKESLRLRRACRACGYVHMLTGIAAPVVCQSYDAKTQLTWPQLMVPYETTKPFPITEDYTVPAGAMVMCACHRPHELIELIDGQSVILEQLARPSSLSEPGRLRARTLARRRQFGHQ